MFSDASVFVLEVLRLAEPFAWPFMVDFFTTCFVSAAACLLVLTPGESVILCTGLSAMRVRRAPAL